MQNLSDIEAFALFVYAIPVWSVAFWWVIAGLVQVIIELWHKNN